MKIDKVILLLTFEDYTQEYYIFSNVKNYKVFIDNNKNYFEHKHLKKWELYFGYKAMEG